VRGKRPLIQGLTFGSSSGSGIADSDETKQSLPVFEDLIAGRISIDDILAIKDLFW
jgi:hypothetical protein